MGERFVEEIGYRVEKQSDKLTNKQTLKTSTSLRYATPVGKNFLDIVINASLQTTDWRSVNVSV